MVGQPEDHLRDDSASRNRRPEDRTHPSHPTRSGRIGRTSQRRAGRKLMPVRRNEYGTWFYRKQVRLPDGSRERIFGTPTRNTKAAAEVAEREHVERVVEEFRNPKARREVPKFAEWFNGR